MLDRSQSLLVTFEKLKCRASSNDALIEARGNQVALAYGVDETE